MNNKGWTISCKKKKLGRFCRQFFVKRKFASPCCGGFPRRLPKTRHGSDFIAAIGDPGVNSDPVRTGTRAEALDS
jgi:hypothetical protein